MNNINETQLLPQIEIKDCSIEEADKRSDCIESYTFFDNIVRIKDYIIDLNDRINKGSYGMVYVGTDKKENKFAIKRLIRSKVKQLNFHNLDWPQHRELSKRMKWSKSDDAYIPNEFKILHKLKIHCNIINLVDLFEDVFDDSIYIVFDYFCNSTFPKMDDFVQHFYFSQDKLRFLFSQFLSGVMHIHEHSIAHCDLNPTNILINSNYMLKICDFGEAINVKTSKQSRKQKGAYAFRPPEMISNENLMWDPFLADIWSMGITLYWWSFGELPFKGHDYALINSIVNENITFPKCSNSNLCSTLSRMLEKNPEIRIRLHDIIKEEWLTKKQAFNEENISMLCDEDQLHKTNKHHSTVSYTESTQLENNQKASLFKQRPQLRNFPINHNHPNFISLRENSSPK